MNGIKSEIRQFESQLKILIKLLEENIQIDNKIYENDKINSIKNIAAIIKNKSNSL